VCSKFQLCLWSLYKFQGGGNFSAIFCIFGSKFSHRSESKGGDSKCPRVVRPWRRWCSTQKWTDRMSIDWPISTWRGIECGSCCVLFRMSSACLVGGGGWLGVPRAVACNNGFLIRADPARNRTVASATSTTRPMLTRILVYKNGLQHRLKPDSHPTQESTQWTHEK